jgi:LysR family transcriptional activator of nhaA
MKPWINYHHLYYFKTIAEQGSVSKAAEKLLVGQPTLSAQLKQFEDNIGIKLFDRHHKKLIITEQGKVALDYAKSIFQMGSEMYEVLHDRTKPLKPMLHIGALDSIPKQVMLELTKKALKFSPCQITLSEANSDKLLRELSAHRMDMVITNFLPTGADAKGIYPKLITKKNIAIYGAPKFKALRKNFPYSISGEPLVFPTYDSKLRPDLDHWAKVHGIEINIVVESQDVAVKKLMAINKIGLVATATHTVTKELRAGELIEIGKLQGVHEELYILSTNRKIPNTVAEHLIKTFNF